MNNKSLIHIPVWPGPLRLYEAVLVMAAYTLILHLFNHSGFAMALISCLTVCIALLHGALRKDLSFESWQHFNRDSVLIIRAAALASGVWLMLTASSLSIKTVATLLYVILYAVCERAAWQRKQSLQAANNNDLRQE